MKGRAPLGPKEVELAIGKRLRAIRQEQRKTMKQVAPFLGISFDTVSLMEKGRLSIPVPRLILWCLCLGVDPGEVLKLALDDISEREIADG